MNNTKYIIVIVSLLLAVSCGKSETIADIQERAGKTAEAYYTLLLEGKYDDFVSGTYGGDSLPASYREQLVANAAMYVQQQKDAHQGIKSIKAIRCVADTAHHTAQAYLEISYADSIKETITVPLVSHNDIWYMK